MRKLLAIAACAIGVALPALAHDRSEISVVAPWEVTSADPAVSGFAFQRTQVMEALVDADAQGNLRPGLASSWEVSEDHLTWRFQIRQGVVFHDGTPLTAAIAAEALTRALAKPGILKKAPIGTIKADGGDVVVTLERPFAALPSLLAHSTTLIPSPTALDPAGTITKAIGTGPFQVTEFSPPQSIDLARFDGYWGKKATLETVHYLAAGRAETRALMAESGDADVVFTLDPSGYSRLKSAEKLDVKVVPIPRVITLKVNAGHPFLSEPDARRALSLAIDREGIAYGIIRFPEAQATQLFPKALGQWHDPALPALGYDPAEAQRLLESLGWRKGDDGILTRDGKRFSILLRTFPDRPELPLIATALQAQFREIGIELEVSVSNYSEIPAGHKDGSLHVALYARNYGLTPDPIGTLLADFGAGGGDWGAMNWDAPKVAKALAEIAASDDADLRASKIAEVRTILHDELPVIPVLWYQQTVAIATGLKGVVIDPLERSYGLSEVTWTK